MFRMELNFKLNSQVATQGYAGTKCESFRFKRCILNYFSGGEEKDSLVVYEIPRRAVVC
jgi:hypothetical protein